MAIDKRYIFFRGILDTLDLYTTEFVRIYTAQGAECLVLDAPRMDTEMVRLKAFLLEPVTAVISLNNVGMHLELEDGRNIWDSFQVPFFNILMDHPFHYKQTLDTAPEQMILLCMDRNHVQYVRRFFPNIRRVEFFPHAGIAADPVPIGSTSAGERPDKLPIADRRIDVLYAGGLSRYAAEGLIPDLGCIPDFDAFALVEQALGVLIREPEQTTEAVIERCLGDMGVTLTEKRLGEVLSELRFVDSFAVSFYREQIIRELVEHGVAVTVFGNGWERCEWADHPNFLYGGEVPPGQILELMGQSKIVLNTMTWFKRGAHDRIFNGMLAGAAVVSDVSEYLLEQFADGRELAMFSLRDSDHLYEIIWDLLEHPQRAQEIADRGYFAARESHLWTNRLSLLDEMHY